MTRLVVTETIAAPPDWVFALATDLAGAADRIDGIESLEVLTGGAFGVGTRWRETRQMFGKPSTEEMEVTAFEPDRYYTTEAASHGCRYVSRFMCEPIGDSTRASLFFEGHPATLGARVMVILMAPLNWLMRRQVRRLLAEDLAGLRRAAEARDGEQAQ